MIKPQHRSADVSPHVVSAAVGFPGRTAVKTPTRGADPLASFGTRVEFRSHDAMIHEGDDAGWLFRIKNGTVKLQRNLADGRCPIVGLLFADDFLGFAGEAAAPYSAYAVGVVSADRFSRRAMEQLCESSIPAVRLLLRWANEELMVAQEQMLLLGCKTPHEKFASFLLRLIHRQDNPNLISLPMTRTDIGDYLGLTLETVSRTMSEFRRDGLITPLGRRAVRIVDLPSIEDLADCVEMPSDLETNYDGKASGRASLAA
jgi:CRP/FNR family transcriptional regulator